MLTVESKLLILIVFLTKKCLLQVQIDPYLGISDDLQVYVRPQMDIRGYGSVTDNQLATSLLLELRNKIYESENIIMDILVQNLSIITEVWHIINGLGFC